MKKTATLALILIASVVFTGCATVDVTKTAAGYYSPTDPNRVEILKTRPDRSYTELGTVTVTGFSSRDIAKMHNAVRAKAAPLGANAVVLIDEGMVPAGYGTYQIWASGVAIHYKKN